ncbi:MAG: phosphate acetyltransferase [Cardiobacteriaceae bacterium]|nr:phosphate acetyltransferase [Cardiobacteriaceae bacterium]
MSKAILVATTHERVGLSSTILGLYHALDRQGLKTIFHKPVLQMSRQSDDDLSAQLLRSYCRGSDKALSISAEQVQRALDNGTVDELMETAIQYFNAAKGDAEIVLMEGLVENPQTPHAHAINRKIARALNADVVLVGDARVSKLTHLESQIDYAANNFGGYEKQRLLGAIINYVDDDKALLARDVAKSRLFNDKFRLLGMVPNHSELSAPRALDLQRHLNANILFSGEMKERRVHNHVMFARSVQGATGFLQPKNSIFLAGDRSDALMAVTIAARSGVKLACAVLVGPLGSETIMELCKPLLQESALPVFHIEAHSWEASVLMQNFNRSIPLDDEERVNATKEFFAEHIKQDWMRAYVSRAQEMSLSPAAFRYQIVQRAIKAQKTIVLPEGDEPRTVVAASICAERGMARCILLAEPESVRAVAARQGVNLGENVIIIDPASVREKYVARLVELRKNKGMTEEQARDQLSDSVVLGTMMLEAGEVDGLVSGAVHTTANTIRPPLQIIKTAPNATMVSSVFFMCLPDQVLVYGDCAIVPNPNADELAQIAIQSHDSAKAFGIEPRVAMISYSTGTSGAGADVEKVKQATDKVRELRPDIVVDGPLQYDAAAVESVGKQKAPNSPVAGRANVFIFPDLNTGNTTYKAVQRSAEAISMGPVLQGMRKPVNDLSRGALVDDIVYTIAITAVQATQSALSL